MGFFSPPKPPKPIPPPNAPVSAKASEAPIDPYNPAVSLINTSPSGMSRKAFTKKTSLIGGSS